MDYNDPWDWTTDRVVQEFCTNERSWQLRSASMVTPDLSLLEKILREEQVTGDTLLNDVDDAVLRNDFGLKTLGQRGYVKYGIEVLRHRSRKYKAQLQRNQPSKFDEVSFGVGNQSVPGVSNGERHLLVLSESTDATTTLNPEPSNGITGDEATQDEDITSDASNKRHRQAFSSPNGDAEPQFAGPGQYPIIAEPIIQNMESSLTEVDANDDAPRSSKKRKRIAPTLITSLIDPHRNREIATLLDRPYSEDPLVVDEVAESPIVEPEDSPITKPEVPPMIEPGVVFIDRNGRKKLVPICQPDPDGSYNEQKTRSVHAGGHAKPKKPNKGRQIRKTVGGKVVSSYLGKQKVAIDDIFYGKSAIGEELLEMDSPDLCTGISTGHIPNGQRLYIHNVMKHYLRRGCQEFWRGDRRFNAVIPYSEKLTSKFQQQSITLFALNDSGLVQARREALSSWPELHASGDLEQKLENPHVFAFNPTGPGILENVGAFEESFDLSYLEDKYKYLEGGDDVLTIYGNSDEENDYDIKTWKEMEDERGEKLDRPLRPTKRAHISPEEVDEAMGQGIDVLVTRWTNKALPKLQLRAYNMWRKARKYGDKRGRIAAAQADLEISQRRIENMRKEILEDVWTSKAQVLKQVPIMEIDVFAREEMQWKINLLESNICPKKASAKALPSIAKSQNSHAHEIDSQEGESLQSESEASSSDDGLGDFVVADELLPTTEQEMFELNLADSEEELIEQDNNYGNSLMSDDNVSTSLTKAFRVKSKAKMRHRMSEDSVTGEDSSSKLTPLSTPVPQSSKANIKCEGQGHQQLLSPVSRKVPEFYDLTITSSDDSLVIDLITPQKPRLRLINKNSPFRKMSSPITLSESEAEVLPDPHDLPPLNNPKAISKYSYVAWAVLLDRDRLLVRVFDKMEASQRRAILDFVHGVSEDDLWDHMSTIIEAYRDHYERSPTANRSTFKGIKGMDQSTMDILSGLFRLFQIYFECSYRAWGEFPERSSIEQVTPQMASQFRPFYQLCRLLHDTFPPQTPLPHSQNRNIGSDNERDKMADASDSEEDEEEDARLPIHRRIQNAGDEQDSILTTSRKKKRVKKIRENAEARDLREQDRLRLELQEERRKKLQANLAESGHANDEARGRIIINDAAGELENYHYITPFIASQIKKHQIDGVRFMWNQIVTRNNDEAMQGCLLAHTMGLGKTMQTITLLVAIAEAAASIDPLISSQIPEKLRRSQTLVLCPAGLIDNWMEELWRWVPKDTLGPLKKVTATSPWPERLHRIEKWNQAGGVLIIGYDMFRNIIANDKNGKNQAASLTKAQHELVTKHLLEGPNIIIADEAHKMKNAMSKITKAATKFRSNSRIALTGSPLANNVEEYHTMIDWVAPNYLGPVIEFRSKYVEPIERGLWQDSPLGEYRRALKMLGVLKETLAPKVHRADMSVLRNDLPPKKEFVITVPLTDPQKKAYSLYVKFTTSTSSGSTTKSGEVAQTTLWSWLAILSLICNHPKCFNTKIHNSKDEAQKSIRKFDKSPSLLETSDGDENIDDLDALPSKVGVSLELIAAATRLFEEEAVDLESIDLSYKVQILCQILRFSRDAGDKCLIFSHSLLTLDFLEHVCKSIGISFFRLDGKSPVPKRQEMCKTFNQGKTGIFLISTAAGSLGLNLYGANRVIIFDFKFNPIMEEQAVGRAYRIGQEKPTFVYRFVAGGTFEDLVHNKTVFKMQLASRVVDKKNPVAYASRKVSDFLFEPKEVEQKDLSEFQGMDPLVLDKILASQADTATIRGIVQTDTFEKDDDDKLTAEEQIEVDRMCAAENMRRTNPEAFNALQVEELSKSVQLAQQRAQYQAQGQAQRQAQVQAQYQLQSQIQAHRQQLSASRSEVSTPIDTVIRPTASQPSGPPNLNPPTNSPTVEKPAILPPPRPDLRKTKDVNEIATALVNPSPHTPHSLQRTVVVGGSARPPHSPTLTPTPLRHPLTEALDTPSIESSTPANSSKSGQEIPQKKATYTERIHNSLSKAIFRIAKFDPKEFITREARAEEITGAIKETIGSMTSDKSEMKKAMRLASIQLMENATKCDALVSSSLSVHGFIYDVVEVIKSKPPSAMVDVPNSGSQTPVGRDRPNARELTKTPKIDAERRSTRILDDDAIALQRINSRRRARGEEEVASRKSSRRIPGWAEVQIGEAQIRRGSSGPSSSRGK